MKAGILESLLMCYARHFPIRRGKLRIVDALWRTAARGEGAHRIATLKHAGMKMPCDLRGMLQRQFYFFGTYFLEEAILECWSTEAKKARVIFDVGANAGIYSLAALAAQPEAVVHAFEPTPEIAAQLRKTAALNGLARLEVHEMAVSAADGFAALTRYRGDLGVNEGMNFITSENTAASAERVQTVCLDGFCAARAIERIDLLKIDIQGNEPLALAGARALLQAGRIGLVFIELNWAPDRKTTSPASEAIRLLGDAGYQFAAPDDPLQWHAPGAWLEELGDVVARSPAQGRVA